MNLNILQPGKAVGSAFEKPNVLIGLVLVIIPALIAAIGFFAYSAAVDWNSFALEQIVKKYAFFILTAILVFFVGLVFNKKETLAFKKIISALGLSYIPAAIAALVSLVVPRLVFSPEFLSAVQNIGGSATTQEFAVNAQIISSTMAQGINFVVFGAMLVLEAILVVWGLFLVYKTISFVSKEKPWINIVSLFIIILVNGILVMLF